MFISVFISAYIINTFLVTVENININASAIIFYKVHPPIVLQCTHEYLANLCLFAIYFAIIYLYYKGQTCLCATPTSFWKYCYRWTNSAFTALLLLLFLISKHRTFLIFTSLIKKKKEKK